MKARANRLQELRKNSGKSQTLVGDLLGISQSRISDFEKGENIPSDILKMFAEYYGVSVDYILCLTDEKYGEISKSVSSKESGLIRFYRSLPSDLRNIFDGIIAAFSIR